MALLSRDAILQAKDGRTKDVEVPAWGGAVRVRTWTIAERNHYQKRLDAKEDQLLLGAWLVATLVVDDSGRSIFTPQDIKELEKKDAEAVDLVTTAIFELNTPDKEAVAEAKKN